MALTTIYYKLYNHIKHREKLTYKTTISCKAYASISTAHQTHPRPSIERDGTIVINLT
ncbi:hypothetical protein HanIR_Chr06g0264701 [Helianthus annuus]|nr:hypothetical protein HanIR_Chr06g0264701 [Helianthus annuus]